jgi:chromosome segregation ATPase
VLAQATKALDEIREENSLLQRRKKLPKRVSGEGVADDVPSLQSALESERQRVQTLSGRVDALETENKAMAANVDRLKNQLREEEKACEDLSQLMADVRKGYATLQATHQQTGSTIEDLRAQLAASEQRVSAAEAAMQAGIESAARVSVDESWACAFQEMKPRDIWTFLRSLPLLSHIGRTDGSTGIPGAGAITVPR